MTSKGLSSKQPLTNLCQTSNDMAAHAQGCWSKRYNARGSLRAIARSGEYEKYTEGANAIKALGRSATAVDRISRNEGRIRIAILDVSTLTGCSYERVGRSRETKNRFLCSAGDEANLLQT